MAAPRARSAGGAKHLNRDCDGQPAERLYREVDEYLALNAGSTGFVMPKNLPVLRRNRKFRMHRRSDLGVSTNQGAIIS